MQIKTITWNVGGAKELEAGKDPLLMSSYNVDAVQAIADYLKQISPDIVTLQEVQGNDNGNQVEALARLMGYEYYFYEATSDSHIDVGHTLGNGIISKYPISDHTTGVFLNPKAEALLEGTPVTSHDKGYGSCMVSIDGVNIRVSTTHLLPFRMMGIDLGSDMGKKILASVERSLATQEDKVLIQGDFNIDSELMAPYLPNLVFDQELEEVKIDHPTTPKGSRYDHVLFKGMTLKTVTIDSQVNTDHYPVICTFDS